MLFSQYKERAVELMASKAFNAYSFDTLQRHFEFVAQHQVKESGEVLNPEKWLSEIEHRLSSIAWDIANPIMEECM